MTRETQIKQAAVQRYGGDGQYTMAKVQAFIVGARYADSTLTERAVEWLINASNDGLIDIHNGEEFEREFRKAMEE